MNLKIAARMGFASVCAILIVFFGCSGDQFIGSRLDNRVPEVWLSSGPVEGDTSGVYSMPYREYCVTMLEKVSGLFRTDADMPMRRDALDALQYVLRADADPVTATNPALPATLDLWEEVTKAGRFFDPRVCGYTYVEIYNPKYWMDAKQTKSRNCFHPMYLMRTRNTASPRRACTSVSSCGSSIARPSTSSSMSYSRNGVIRPCRRSTASRKA